MSVMTTLKAEIVERDLRLKAKKFCSLADTCLHIGRNECAQCLQSSLKVILPPQTT